MNLLPQCLGLVQESEKQLAEALAAMADRHSRDFEIKTGCQLFASWCRAHVQGLEPFHQRYGCVHNSDPDRLRSALFHGHRVGGFGLLRDLQDLHLLTHQARQSWTVLEQAGKELNDLELDNLAHSCAGETDRQIDWLCTHIKTNSPQVLTVQPKATAELKDSFPKRPTPAGVPDLSWAPFVSGLIVLILGLISLAVGRPWLLPSLGPTAFIVTEMPEHPNSRFYNVLVGHLIALGAGFLSLWVVGAWNAPIVLQDWQVTAPRVWASVIAIALTLLVTMILKATHPASAATALLVTLGSIQTGEAAFNLIVGVLLIAVIGEGFRQLRVKASLKNLNREQPEILSTTTNAKPRAA